MHLATTGTRIAEWKRGWPVVLSASVAFAMSLVHSYSLGIFMEPLEKAFGWSRSTVSAGPLIVSILSIATMPLVGVLLDKVDIRKIAIPGMIAYVLSIGGLGLTGPASWTWWLGFTLVAITHAFANTAIWALGVASWFDRSRGLALSIALAGSGLCQALAPPFTEAAVEAFGWRGGYFALAAVGLCVVVPLLLLCFRDGRPAYRMRPIGEIDPAPTDGALDPVAAPAVAGMNGRQGVRSFRFWRMGLASFLITLGISPLMVHFVPAMTEGGLTRPEAVGVASIIGLSTIAGRMGTGFLLDRMPAAIVGLIAFGTPVIVCVALVSLHLTVATAIPIAVLLGISNGAEIEVIAYLTARYFGLRSYGFLLSILTGLLAFGGGLGPFVAGVVHDRSGSYTPFFVMLMLTFSISTLLIITLGRYPELGDETVGVDG